jgi:hypothetical protein
LIAWNEPMGRPNCRRCVAYSTAPSKARWAVPTSSAANTVSSRATGSSIRGSTMAGASSSDTEASGSITSSASTGSRRTPGPDSSTSNGRPSGPKASNWSASMPNGTVASSPRTVSPAPETDRVSESRRPGTTEAGKLDHAGATTLSPATTEASTAPSTEPAPGPLAAVSAEVTATVPTTGTAASAAPTCSATTQTSSNWPPAPPSDSGTASPSSPSSANAAHSGRFSPIGSRCQSGGSRSFSAASANNRATVRRSSRRSSVHSTNSVICSSWCRGQH